MEETYKPTTLVGDRSKGRRKGSNGGRKERGEEEGGREGGRREEGYVTELTLLYLPQIEREIKICTELTKPSTVTFNMELIKPSTLAVKTDSTKPSTLAVNRVDQA